MSYRLLLATLSVALASAASLGQAHAADLGMPSFGAQQLPEDRVEFGSGWYVRGDIAETQDYTLGLARVSTTTEGLGIAHSSNIGYDLSLGGGYKFTNAIRADITADFHQPVQTNVSNTECVSNPAVNTCSIAGKFNHYDALANAYYDFGTWYRMTPYVGAGAGVGFGELNATLYDGTSTYVAKSLYHSFAWALMAGVSIDVYDHTKLDVGYRYLNNGNSAGTTIYYHQIRAGLRYMIDD